MQKMLHVWHNSAVCKQYLLSDVCSLKKKQGYAHFSSKVAYKISFYWQELREKKGLLQDPAEGDRSGEQQLSLPHVHHRTQGQIFGLKIGDRVQIPHDEESKLKMFFYIKKT